MAIAQDQAKRIYKIRTTLLGFLHLIKSTNCQTNCLA